MQIFFTTPFEGKKTYQKYIDLIISLIEEQQIKVVSFEKPEQKKYFYKTHLSKYGSREKTHYEFIRTGIASSDAVVIEASYEDFRVGHEATLAILYKKPVLVLSVNKNYGKLIPHEQFQGKKYNQNNIKQIIHQFIRAISKKNINGKTESSTLNEEFDIQHTVNLSQLRMNAQLGKDYVADWARRLTDESETVYEEINKKLGYLKVHEPWSIFAKIYDQDTPDFLLKGPSLFVNKIFSKIGIKKDNLIVDVACGTGSMSRLLTGLRYSNILAFDRSRPMLSEAYKFCAYLPSIKIIESDINNLKLTDKAKAMVWVGYSTNYAMNTDRLASQLTTLLDNIEKNGCVIFDIRTLKGWQVNYYQQKVTIYETDSFQRIWINLQDSQSETIKFDIFIRLKDKFGNWLEWEREQMEEKMWRLQDVYDLVCKLSNAKLVGIF